MKTVWYALSGNTYPIRRTLFMFDGQWLADKKCWIVPEFQLKRLRKKIAEYEITVTKTEIEMELNFVDKPKQ